MDQEQLTSRTVDNLVDYARATGLLCEEDRCWAVNRLMAWISAGSDAVYQAQNAPVSTADKDIEDLLDNLFACAQSLGNPNADDPAKKDSFCAGAMDLLMPRPSQVNEEFSLLRETQGGQTACDYLYKISCDTNYVHKKAIARDIKWLTDTAWGQLEITINKSKPEKDPRAIAALANPQAKQASAAEPYPACQLCTSNEGYEGRLFNHPKGSHPARQNLRIARIQLNGEPWGLQFSPYAYFNQHCIVLNEKHTPMHIDRGAFCNLIEFVQEFPQYLVGSNADLPVVGGSILNHDHYQGGGHVFPMERARITETFAIPGFPDVSGAVLAWPLSVLKLTCANASELIDAADHVLQTWRGYSDPEAGVFAETDGTPHNTITPIARKTDEGYVLYLALRCNISSPEHPLGVFHPHEHLHHIKKENIGLIEVMGLAILPGRLSDEMQAVEQALVERWDADALAANKLTEKHAAWVQDLLAHHQQVTPEAVHQLVQDEVGAVFCQVLECAGVFKWDEQGRAAQKRFLQSL